ncbi:MAG: sugar ABC transporter permease [Bacillota bacterium]|jgi:multiple sugar transport system permease protein|nr:sugar ABC transporter permease [Bacillota bacterium]
MGSLAQRGGLSVQTKRYLFCYLGLLPVVMLFVWLRVGPLASTINLSFHDWNLIKLNKPFVGLKNYINLFGDRLFLMSLKNTTIFAVGTVAIGMLLALPLALALNRSSKLGAFYQAVYFLPVITPMVPVSVIFKWIYDPGYGLLNYVLSFFGVKPVGWLMYPNLALASIIAMCIWKNIGYHMIMFLVGLKNISEQYYEAAAIDGANKWQIFWSITLPLLKPILLYVFITTTIEGFNIFTPVYVMTTGSQGAPGNAVRTLVYNIYEEGFRYFKMGYASSQAVMLLLIVLVVTVIQMRIFRGEDGSASVQ